MVPEGWFAACWPSHLYVGNIIPVVVHYKADNIGVQRVRIETYRQTCIIITERGWLAASEERLTGTHVVELSCPSALAETDQKRALAWALACASFARL